jgi:tryptophanyl-tRNA synthetase
VPVGIDQEPHIEIAREIARKVNQKFGTDLPEPVRFSTPVSSVPSLTGEGKMSKSVAGSTIFLTDSLEQIKKKISGIPTNSGKGSFQPGQQGKKEVTIYIDENGSAAPGLTSLFEFVEFFQGKTLRSEYEKAYSEEGVRFGEIKTSLAEALYQDLKPIQERRESFVKQENLVDQILIEGAKKAQAIASKTLSKVKKAYGFYNPNK